MGNECYKPEPDVPLLNDETDSAQENRPETSIPDTQENRLVTCLPHKENDTETKILVQENRSETNSLAQESFSENSLSIQRSCSETSIPIQESCLATNLPVQESCTATSLSVQESCSATSFPLQETSLVTSLSLSVSENNYIVFNNSLKDAIRETFIEFIIPKNVIIVFWKYNKKILVQKDIDKVNSTDGGNGQEACEVLLDRLSRYEGWFPCLLKCLRDKKVMLQHVAEMLEAIEADVTSDFNKKSNHQTNESHAKESASVNGRMKELQENSLIFQQISDTARYRADELQKECNELKTKLNYYTKKINELNSSSSNEVKLEELLNEYHNLVLRTSITAEDLKCLTPSQVEYLLITISKDLSQKRKRMKNFNLLFDLIQAHRDTFRFLQATIIQTKIISRLIKYCEIKPHNASDSIDMRLKSDAFEMCAKLIDVCPLISEEFVKQGIMKVTETEITNIKITGDAKKIRRNALFIMVELCSNQSLSKNDFSKGLKEAIKRNLTDRECFIRTSSHLVNLFAGIEENNKMDEAVNDLIDVLKISLDKTSEFQMKPSTIIKSLTHLANSDQVKKAIHKNQFIRSLHLNSDLLEDQVLLNAYLNLIITLDYVNPTVEDLTEIQCQELDTRLKEISAQDEELAKDKLLKEISAKDEELKFAKAKLSEDNIMKQNEIERLKNNFAKFFEDNMVKQNEIERLQSNLAKFLEDNTVKQNEIERLKSNVAKFLEEKMVKQNEIERLKSNLDKLFKDNMMKQKEIERLNDNLAMIPENNILERNIIKRTKNDLETILKQEMRESQIAYEKRLEENAVVRNEIAGLKEKLSEGTSLKDSGSG